MFNHELSLRGINLSKRFPPEKKHFCFTFCIVKQKIGEEGNWSRGRNYDLWPRKFSILIISTYVTFVFPSHLPFPTFMLPANRKSLLL